MHFGYGDDSLKLFSIYSMDTVETQFCDRQSSREITHKVYMQELWFLHTAHRLMLIDICRRFHKDSLNCFQVIERTRFCDRETD